jgi:hypothetical protein
MKLNLTHGNGQNSITVLDRLNTHKRAVGECCYYDVSLNNNHFNEVMSIVN